MDAIEEEVIILTGEESEWEDITELNDGELLYQNKRCDSVFKTWSTHTKGIMELNGNTFT